jgi:Fe-S-cluster containining protein
MSRREAGEYLLGLVPFQEAFDSARHRLGDAVPCRRGCSACCEDAAVFEIHAADAALLQQGLLEAAPESREAIRGRARDLLERLRTAAAALALEGETLLEDWEPLSGLALPDRIVERLAAGVRGRCPVLDASGDCALHAHRPAICRLQGIPWRDPATGADLPDFCRLDPRQAGLAAQDAPLHALDDLREEVRLRLQEAAGERAIPARTTVAAALLAGASG